jgi:hypothetical protein
LAGNKENMDKVKALMAQAEQVRQGSGLTEVLHIDFTSLCGKHYKGDVVVHRPDLKDFMKMGGIKSEFLRKAGVVNLSLVDMTVKETAQVMATLTVVVDKCPEWMLSIEAIDEPDVLFHVYDKYMEWTDSFRAGSAEKSSEDSSTSEGKEDMDS